ncbi:MarR family winged helix-turn-helix transcriptional regulator [Methylobacterium sp. D48H]
MSNEEKSLLLVPADDQALILGHNANKFVELDQLLGMLRRKNNALMEKAFALSKDKLTRSIIWRLSESGPLTAKELSALTGSSPSTISGVVTRLVSQEIVVKRNGPRGTEPISISEEYQAPIKQHVEYVKYLLGESFCVLGTQERDIFIDNIRKITKRLDELAEIVDKNPGHYFIFDDANEDETAGERSSSSKKGGESQKSGKQRRKNNSYNVTIVDKQTHILERIIKITSNT